MRTSVLASIALVVLGAVAAGCDESLADLAGPTPNLRPTFSSIQREIFEATDASGRPACTQCHIDVGGRPPDGFLNLRSTVAYTNLVGAASRAKAGAIRVIPGDPENSYLVHKLEGRPTIVGSRMPGNNGPFLTDGQMLVIKRWIELGARND